MKTDDASADSPQPHTPDLWHRCLGREREIQLLLERWQSVLTDSQPCWVNLIADSGWGKTRLIHEFYEQISKLENHEHSGENEGYWPDRLTTDPTSLHIVPSLAQSTNPSVTIPWMWVGLRGANPDSRNTLQSSALHDIERQVKPHLQPLLMARLRKEAGKESAKYLIQLTSQLFGYGVVGDLLTGGEELKKYLGYLKQMKADREDASGTSVSEFAAREKADLADRCLDTFSLFLDARKKELPTVPVILVLDDAQWLASEDPDTLNFLGRLWKQAQANKWPLMVLATHYEKEWNEFVPEKPGGHIRKCFADGDSAVIPHKLEAIRKELSKNIVSASFPGITDKQRGYIVDRAAANMRFLMEMLLYLRDDPTSFVDEDHRQPLSEAGFEAFQSISTDWRTFVRKRISALDREMRASLNICGAQGLQFLDEIAREVAVDLSERGVELSLPLPSSSQLEDHAASAENPHALISLRLLEELDRRIGEFRHPEYLAILQDPTILADGDRAAIRESTSRVLLSAFRSDRLPLDRALTWELLLANVGLQAATDRDAAEQRVPVLIGAFRFFYDRFDNHASRAASSELMDLTQLHELDSLTFADHEILGPLARHLIIWDAFSDSQRINQSLEQVYREGISFDPTDHAARRNLAISLDFIGDVLREQGDREGAMVRYEEGLRLREKLVTDFGETPESLRDLSVSLDRIGDGLLEEGDREGAMVRYEEILKNCEKIVTYVGETPKSLRNWSVCLCKVGDVLLGEGDREGAMVRYEEGLRIFEKIVSDVGETPLNLSDWAGCLYKVGDVLIGEGDWKGAMGRYEESLRLFERIATDFGETPDSLRHKSVILDRVGDMLFREGDREGAMVRYNESLELREKIVNNFGETPESMRNWSASLDRIGDVLRSQGDYDGAMVRYEESLRVCKKIVSDFGESQQNLRDWSVSLDRVGDMLLGKGDRERAMVRYVESLELREKISGNFGETPESLRDCSVCLIKVGDVLLGEGDRTRAMVRYEEGLELRAKIVSDFGETPVSLHDWSSSLARVGDVLLSEGDHKGAMRLYEENLGLRKKILSIFGENPESLRELSVSLIKVGDTLRGEGDLEGAMDRYHKSLRVFEKVLSLFGETPESIRDLFASESRLMQFAQVSEDWHRFAHKAEKVRELWSRSLELAGPNIQVITDGAFPLIACLQVAQSNESLPSTVTEASQSTLNQATQFIEQHQPALQAALNGPAGASEAANRYLTAYSMLKEALT
ncbi:MAG: tetratricopeptide repeat protein [Verrucomicrobiota bacterium]